MWAQGEDNCLNNGVISVWEHLPGMLLRRLVQGQPWPVPHEPETWWQTCNIPRANKTVIFSLSIKSWKNANLLFLGSHSQLFAEIFYDDDDGLFFIANYVGCYHLSNCNEKLKRWRQSIPNYPHPNWVSDAPPQGLNPEPLQGDMHTLVQTTSNLN